MKAFSYLRVSSESQISGTSLLSQQREIEAYAQRTGLELVRTFTDAGISGGIALADRPQGKAMIEALERSEAMVVIVTKLDRGFRSASDCLNCAETWERAGISLHLLNLGGQTIDTSSPVGKFFLTVMAGAAELEKNLIRERCNEGRKARKKEGKRIGQVPFGYKLADDGRTLLEDQREQEALTLIRALRSKGHSLRAIAAELNARNIRAKKGGTWKHGQVQSVLKRAA
jgi:site-specific DNA recombinase